MITKNECEKSLLKTNVKTIIKMNVQSLLNKISVKPFFKTNVNHSFY